MSLVERTLDSGLIVAQAAAITPRSSANSRSATRCSRCRGGRRRRTAASSGRSCGTPARTGRRTPCACGCRERGEPYPLSSGILDLVDRLDRNTRHGHVGEDEINAARDRELERQKARDREAIVDDHLFKHGRPLLPRSQSLRMARDKQRAKGRKV